MMTRPMHVNFISKVFIMEIPHIVVILLLFTVVFSLLTLEVIIFSHEFNRFSSELRHY